MTGAVVYATKMTTEKRAHLNAYARRYRLEHPDKIKYYYKRKFNDDELRAEISRRNRDWWSNPAIRQLASEKMSGANNPNWKGGITPKSKRLRRGWKHRKWRLQILSRDKNQCIICCSNENLEVDHIKPISKYPELAYDIENGRTLCKNCHKQTDTYAGKTR